MARNGRRAAVRSRCESSIVAIPSETLLAALVARRDLCSATKRDTARPQAGAGGAYFTCLHMPSHAFTGD